MRFLFDRGTLVLEAQPSAALRELSQLRWDDRIGAYRAPAYCYEQLRSRLARTGTPLRDNVLRRGAAVAGFAPISLRPYQQTALEAWLNKGQGLVVLPTGAGKTRLACAAMASSQVPALCLVPTRALLHQWCAAIAQHYSGPIGRLGDGERHIEAVTVATFESAFRLMPRLGDHFELLIVDEAHHFGSAAARDEALEMCAAPRRLALTATAPEGDALERLQALMGPRVIELSIADLAGLWLADYELVVLTLPLTADERKRYLYALKVFREHHRGFLRMQPQSAWRDYVGFASRSEQGRRALAAFRASRRLTAFPAAKRHAVGALLREHRGQRVLVFVPDNATAYAIARRELVMPLTCDIDRRERESALAAFRSGELTALVSAQVLNEGIDVPDAEVAIIVGGTRGAREHVQRVGRLLRPAPGKRAMIYELVVAGTHELHKASERRRALQAQEHTERA